MSARPLAVAVLGEELEPTAVAAPPVHLAVDVGDPAGKIRIDPLLAHAHLQIAPALPRDVAARGGGALAPVLSILLLEHCTRTEIAERRQPERLLDVGWGRLVDE